MMSRIEQLNAIAETPNKAFSWISKRKKVEKKLEKIPVSNVTELKAQYWWIDLYDANFAFEMGWV